jgi:hypothetical protein
MHILFDYIITGNKNFEQKNWASGRDLLVFILDWKKRISKKKEKTTSNREKTAPKTGPFVWMHQFCYCWQTLLSATKDQIIAFVGVGEKFCGGAVLPVDKNSRRPLRSQGVLLLLLLLGVTGASVEELL